jgi:cyclopropane fatty-acyl-phospholipid synthase-like methyltransferase
LKDGGYEDGYKTCGCFWGHDPSSLVVDLSRRISSFAGLQVLDAGCGEGKNSIYLANKGALVTAFDISNTAIEHAKVEQQRSGSQIRFIVADVDDVCLSTSNFDIILAYGLLHCLRDKAHIDHTVKKLQNATRQSGYFAICAFNDRHQELSAHPGFTPTVLQHQHYVHLFSEWDLLVCTDSDLVETHPHNGIQHTHSMTRVLARKPIQGGSSH